MTEKRSKIKVSNLITGEYKLDEGSTFDIHAVEIFLEGVSEPIAELPVEKVDNTMKFSYVIDSKARIGNYSVVWLGSISGKENKVFDDFTISGDNVDRTLPMELQHLK